MMSASPPTSPSASTSSPTDRPDDVPDGARVVLANRPRLMREMLARLIASRPYLHVVALVDDLALLPSVVAETRPDGVVVSLDLVDGSTGLEFGDDVAAVIGLSDDGTRMRVRPDSPPIVSEHLADLLTCLRESTETAALAV